jgi:NADH:ubiquinone oxidoreductase subunit 6 (subunit J)
VSVLVVADPAARSGLTARPASPRELGFLIFGHYAVAVEIVSLLLFVPLVGALCLGREAGRSREERQ